MEQLLEALEARNPWWTSGAVSKEFASETKRPEFPKLLDELDEKRITTIYGPRRVGKTTLMYQLIEHLLKKGTEPKRLIYISLEDPSFEFQENLLQKIFELYQKFVIKRPLSESRDRVYVFLDEIHYLDGWEKWLKKYFDMKLPVKFVVSGSSALLLQKGLREFLVGRSMEFKIMPLSFWGYVKIKAAASKKDLSKLETIRKRLNRHPFTITKLHSTVKQDLLEWESHRQFLENCFLEYVERGGFPESFETPNLTRWYEKLTSDMLKKTIFRDITQAYGIKSPKNVERLVLFLAEEGGQTFSTSSISRNLDIDRATLASYLTYLSDAFIISEAPLFAKSSEKRLRSNKKLYITDSGLRNALLLDFDILHKPKLGLVVESIVHNHCKQLFGEAYYWRSASRYEVDVVVSSNGSIIPIEVKYKDKIKKKELRGLARFLRSFNTKTALVVTKGKFGCEQGLVFIPIWLFLLT